MEVRDRISYQALNFEIDTLPMNFDAILLCDVIGIPKQEFSQKLKQSLNTGGRVILLNNLDEESSWLEHDVTQSGFHKANNNFWNSLCAKTMRYKTVNDLKLALKEQGFLRVSEETLDNGVLVVHGFV